MDLGSFLPHDAMLARYLLSSRVCPCVTSRYIVSAQPGESSWFLARRLHSSYHTLCYKEIRFLLPKIRVTLSETLSQTLDIENVLSPEFNWDKVP